MEIQESYKLLIRKVADTNQFLSDEARVALTRLVQQTPYYKSVQNLFPFYDEKSPNVKKQVSSALQSILTDMGA